MSWRRPKNNTKKKHKTEVIRKKAINIKLEDDEEVEKVHRWLYFFFQRFFTIVFKSLIPWTFPYPREFLNTFKDRSAALPTKISNSGFRYFFIIIISMLFILEVCMWVECTWTQLREEIELEEIEAEEKEEDEAED